MSVRSPSSPTDELLLPARTAMGAVTLRTADLDRLASYYREAFGLVEVPTTGGQGGATVVLGRGATPLVEMVHTPGLPPARRGQSGLFHTALLFPDRTALANTVASAAVHPLSRYVGSADHLVSEAFYFTDPDDNGVELYRDRPREEWSWQGDRITMGSLPLDPAGFLRTHADDTAATGGAEVGHVHLKVGDVDLARAFYVDLLGFEVTATWPGALFVSAGGYHHHMAMNTWQSAGSGPRAASIGLGQVTIAVPTREDLDALGARLRRHGIAAADDGLALRFQDPWDSRIEVGHSG